MAKNPPCLRTTNVHSRPCKRLPYSLNDKLLQGPDFTNSLVGVLTRFREERVALMSDVESMFYQVRVQPDDRSVLHFLWWPEGNLDADPEELMMTLHLFGGISSPSCANFALRNTTSDNRQEFELETVNTVSKISMWMTV